MPLLGAIGGPDVFGEVVVAAVPGCHCCCRSWVPLLDAIAGCHWDTTLARLSYSCRSWVPLVDQTFGEVVVAAVPGCHCGCRSWVPLAGGGWDATLARLS